MAVTLSVVPRIQLLELLEPPLPPWLPPPEPPHAASDAANTPAVAAASIPCLRFKIFTSRSTSQLL
jgi:hypothetical protein